jgi:hypothetical protein
MEKKLILSAYQEKLGVGHPDSLVTKKKGTTADEILFIRTHMRPSLNKSYQVSELYLHIVIITINKEHRDFFQKKICPIFDSYAKTSRTWFPRCFIGYELISHLCASPS